MSNHEESRRRLHQLLGRETSGAWDGARGAADFRRDGGPAAFGRPSTGGVSRKPRENGPAADDAGFFGPPAPPAAASGGCALVTRLGRFSAGARWYGQVPSSGSAANPEAGRRGGPAPAPGERALTERMVLVYDAPGGVGDGPGDREAVECWAQRVEAQRGTLRHPHLLHVYGACAEDPLSPLLVTEFPEGGCLSEVLEHSPRLSLAQAASVLAHLCRALAWLHSQDLVHGAVRAENVYFTRESAALLLPHWGSPWDDPVRGTEGSSGSAVSAGHASVPGPAEDVRDLAALVWLMLTAQEPGEAVHRIPLPLLCPEATKPLVRVIEDALDEDPAARPSIQELMQVFRSTVSSEPLRLHASVHPDFAGRLPALPLPREQRPTRRQRAQGLVYEAGSAARRSRSIGSGRDARNDRGNRGGRDNRINRGDRDRAGARRRLRRPGPMTAAAAATVLCLGAGAWFLGPETQDAPSSEQVRAEPAVHEAQRSRTPSPENTEEKKPATPGRDAERALPGLFRARDRALDAGDAGLVPDYAIADGALAGKDRATIEGIARDRLPRISSRLEDTRLVAVSADRATLDTELHLSGYAPKPGEAADQEGSGGSSQHLRVQMSRASGSWKIEDVTVRA